MLVIFMQGYKTAGLATTLIFSQDQMLNDSYKFISGISIAFFILSGELYSRAKTGLAESVWARDG